jgi:hypothetical protein
VQLDSPQILQPQSKNPIIRLYERLYLQLLKARLLLLLLPFSTKLGIVILEEKTHVSETKIRISMITTILILCFGLFSSDLHVFIPGQNSVPSSPQETVKIPSPSPITETTEVTQELVEPDVITVTQDQSELIQRLNNYSTENNLAIESIPESKEEQMLLFEQYESYLQRNPGTPILYLNAAILAFNLKYDNLGTYYLDQAILLNPELKEITN